VGILIIATAMSCGVSAQSSMHRILTGLEKSYVKNLENDLLIDEFLEEYNVSLKRFRTDSIMYYKALDDFYNSDVGIIDHLQTFRYDTTEYCNWLGTIPPYSASIKGRDLVTKSKGAQALIDCYVLHTDKSKIYFNSYVNKIPFNLFIDWFKTRKHLSRESLRKEYLSFLNEFNGNSK
jgi:hypothetical protein